MAVIGIKRLAVAETLAWALCYYSFAALLPHWESDLGWARGTLTGALTVALLVSAGLAPVAGQLIDRGHGRGVMVWGSLLAAMGMLGLSLSQSVVEFYLYWVVLGIGMAGNLYEPCFAVVTRYLGTDAKRAIITITLFAGFAGTLCFPLTHGLMQVTGWRTTCQVFAGGIVVAGGLMAWSIGPDRPAALPEVRSGDEYGVLSRVLRSPLFWLLGSASTMTALNHGAIIAHIMPLLADRGLGAQMAVLAASMIGPMQVVGRLVMMAAGARAPTPWVAVVSYTGSMIAVTALLVATIEPALVVLFVVLQGASYGVFCIVRPALIAEWLGRRGFGLVSGALAIPYTAGYALAPTLAALGERSGGYDLVMVVAIGCSAVGLITTTMAWASVRRRAALGAAVGSGEPA